MLYNLEYFHVLIFHMVTYYTLVKYFAGVGTQIVHLLLLRKKVLSARADFFVQNEKLFLCKASLKLYRKGYIN